ncbi:hypothetical protein [Streptomyces sp. NPDC000880]
MNAPRPPLKVALAESVSVLPRGRGLSSSGVAFLRVRRSCSSVLHPSKPKLDAAEIIHALLELNRPLAERAGIAPVPLFLRAALPEARRKLRTSRQECRQLQDQVDAAATVITALLAENAVLREQLAKRSAVVIPLDRAHAARE